MDIATFARLHGVLIDRPLEDGKWHRVPTESHPKKKNGAYMSWGTYGFVQDHAMHVEPVEWKPDATELAKVDHAAIARRVAQAASRIREDQHKAAKKAAWMLHQCTRGTHPYLVAKGFPEEHGFIYADPQTRERKLCLPMRSGTHLVGLQTITDAEGFEKRFLYGQQTSEAVFCIDNHGPMVFCEGFSTGLSVRRALQALKQRYTLVITFTAGNLLKVARNHGKGFVIADYDRPTRLYPEHGGHGLAVAKQTGLPYWLSDREGEDANDVEQRAGTFRLSMELKKLLMSTPQHTHNRNNCGVSAV